MAAGMFMSGYSLGTFAGPTIGGFIFDFIENSEAAINSDNCNWARNTGKANPCANQYAFKSLAEYICIACVIFTVLYLTLGEGYKGWQDLCCRKKKE